MGLLSKILVIPIMPFRALFGKNAQSEVTQRPDQIDGSAELDARCAPDEISGGDQSADKKGKMHKKRKKRKNQHAPGNRFTRIDFYPSQIIQIIGFPRSGKTLFACKIATDNSFRFPGGIYDCPQMMYSKARAHISVQDWSLHRFSWSLLISDELQIGGLYARNWSQNFKSINRDGQQHENLALAQLSLTGHYHNSYILISHGKNELDSAIRDNNLVRSTYYCRRARFIFRRNWCVAEKMVESSYFDEMGNAHSFSRFPTMKERLFKQGYMIFISIKKYGPLYDTEAHDPRIDALPTWEAAHRAPSQEEQGGDSSLPFPAPADPPKRRRGRPRKQPETAAAQ